MQWRLALIAASSSAYVNNYDARDNAYNVQLPSKNVRENSFAFLIADYGLPTTADGSCCQTLVADAMRAKKQELEAKGKQLIFVGGARAL